jgi:hypothetical protein
VTAFQSFVVDRAPFEISAALDLYQIVFVIAKQPEHHIATIGSIVCCLEPIRQRFGGIAFYFDGLVCKCGPMILRLPAFIGAFLSSLYNPSLEILALRQPVSALKRKNPRPRLKMQDRILLRLIKPGSAGVLANSSSFRSRRNTGTPEGR